MRSLEKFTTVILATSLIIGLSACGEDDDKTDKRKLGQTQDSIHSRVIYGDDDRHDLYDETNINLLMSADSTVALIARENVIEESAAYVHILSTPFATARNIPLCLDERFREQNIAAFCSGFLVKPNVIITAGHCLITQDTPTSDCAQTNFVFGYALKTHGTNLDLVAKSEVYSCKRIIERKQIGNGADFAVVELDRDVVGHMPLPLRLTGGPQVNDQLTVIGHPQGLPTKIAGGANVRSVMPAFFKANLDTYGGNSGSAVLNSVTGEIEGILVRGEKDFIVKNGCMTSYVCPNEGCRGEDVTRISEVLPFLQ